MEQLPRELESKWGKTHTSSNIKWYLHYAWEKWLLSLLQHTVHITTIYSAGCRTHCWPSHNACFPILPLQVVRVVKVTLRQLGTKNISLFSSGHKWSTENCTNLRYKYTGLWCNVFWNGQKVTLLVSKVCLRMVQHKMLIYWTLISQLQDLSVRNYTSRG